MTLSSNSLRNKLLALVFFFIAYKTGAAGAFDGLALKWAVAMGLPGLILFFTYKRAYIDFDQKLLQQVTSVFFFKKRKSVSLEEFTRVKFWHRSVLNVNSEYATNKTVYAVILVGPREHYEVQQSSSRVKMENLAYEIGNKLDLEVEESGVDPDGAADLINDLQWHGRF